MLIVFKDPAKEIVNRPFAESFLLSDMILSLTDTEEAISCSSYKDIPLSGFDKGIYTWDFFVGELITVEIVVLIVKSHKTFTQSHPEASLTIA